MKTAIISDIHGNYPALLAVLADASKSNVDTYIFAGDYIFDLPFPNEVTDLIKGMKNAFVIKGNKEGYLEGFLTEDQQSWNIAQYGVLHQTFKELKPDNISYLNNLPESCLVPLPFHGNIYVTHLIKALTAPAYHSATFRKAMEKQAFTHGDFLEKIDILLQKKDARQAIAAIDATVIVVGHSHLQWHGHCDGKLIINPGSCGQPLDHDIHASYTILHDSKPTLTVEEKRVPYNIENTIRYAKSSAIYKWGAIWCELVFLALRTGQDFFDEFFSLAQTIANEKNEIGKFFSNETWNLAGQKFFNENNLF